MSDADVENYKQIKSDLDELRLLVEKSELWVFKAKSEGKKKKKDDGKVRFAMHGKFGFVTGIEVYVFYLFLFFKNLNDVVPLLFFAITDVQKVYNFFSLFGRLSYFQKQLF